MPSLLPIFNTSLCLILLLPLLLFIRPSDSAPALFNPISLRRIGACPAPYDKLYCHHGGKCVAEVGQRTITPFCRCARQYHGRRCQYTFNSDIYGFSKVSTRVENKALSTVAVVLFLMLITFTWCLLLHRRLILAADRRVHDSALV